MATFTRALSSDSVSKINDFAVAKQPAKVTKQSPVPGTPVIQGMTIEIHAVSLSDVPVYVVDAQAIAAVKNVPIAEVQKLIQDDPRLAKAVETGIIPEADRAYVTEKLNTGLAGKGLSGALSPEDTAGFVKSIGDLGFMDF